MMNEVISYLKMNGDTPISAKSLGRIFGHTDITIRRIINQARLEGVPICSSSKGYYYSECREDINRTVASLMHRITSIQNAVNGLVSNL